jgi:hypothetical protein
LDLERSRRCPALLASDLRRVRPAWPLSYRIHGVADRELLRAASLAFDDDALRLGQLEDLPFLVRIELNVGPPFPKSSWEYMAPLPSVERS